jgi:hypothetical protein
MNSRCEQARPGFLLGAAASVLALMLLGGCLERTISVTSEPQGAVVWINDIEAGRTPFEADFTYYGKFSVRIRKEGYEPIVTVMKVNPPIQEQPGIDLVAEAMPTKFENVVRWHFDLTPTIESRLGRAEAEASVIHEANQLRARLEGVNESAKPADMRSTPTPNKAPADAPVDTTTK